MKLPEGINYVGVNDHQIDLFEGQYVVPDGMAYNSYIICDDKIAVLDTVDARFGEQWLANVKSVLGERKPDYLVVHHMEPDHSANIALFTKEFPQVTVVGNTKTFAMLDNFFGADCCLNKMAVSDGQVLSLGEHSLQFVFAPMVHWPEVMVSYDSTAKTLFSADAFGKFGALDMDDEWACEARRYYFGIVGKYGVQVQMLLKKLSPLDIATICPLHGPMLTENIGYYVNLYDVWSSYGVESDGVCLCYTSVYGHTKQAAEYLADKLQQLGCKVAISDLARCDMAEAVEDAFRYGKLVLATTTYNADIFPFMKEFVLHLTERNYRNRTVAFVENGSWAPNAAKVMKDMLANCKDLTFAQTTVTIRSAMTDDNKRQLDALAAELAK